MINSAGFCVATEISQLTSDDPRELLELSQTTLKAAPVPLPMIPALAREAR